MLVNATYAMDDIVFDLKNRPFSVRSYAEKKEIVETGRPTPSIDKKRGDRNFQTSWYDNLDWLCASKTDNNLYCWPCLLFQPKKGHSWTDKGFTRYQSVLGGDV